MANWVHNWLAVEGIGRDFDEGKIDTKNLYNVMDVQSDGPDCLALDSQWRVPLAAVSQISKESCAGKDVLLIYYSCENNPQLESQMILRDGQITGVRERYNDGFESDDWGEFTPVDAKESQEMLDKAVQLDRREQRRRQAAALASGIETETPGCDLELD